LNAGDYEAKVLATQGFTIGKDVWSYNVDIGNLDILKDSTIPVRAKYSYLGVF
jgi:hypothetical protein